MSYVDYTVYETATGRITGYGYASSEASAESQAGDGESAVVGQKANDLTFYVLSGEITARPTLSFDKTEIVADDNDTATLTGLPDPCVVAIDGTEYEVTGGTLTLTVDTPGTYTVAIPDPFPAQAFSGEITAT